MAERVLETGSFRHRPLDSNGQAGTRVPEKPSIAVLPFTNLSGYPKQDYFADGIVEEITTALSRFHWLFVIARNSSFVFKGMPSPMLKSTQALPETQIARIFKMLAHR